jgi:hypothetical protein
VIWRVAGLTAAAATLVALPVASEIRLRRAHRPLTERWRALPVERRGSTQLGISFRTPQTDAFGLDARATLRTLLGYPFQLVRLGAYWNRIETGAGRFDPSELDRQVDAVERADKQIVLCVGPLKSFGYPEFFVPAHHLSRPLREGALVRPGDNRSLLEAATAFASRVVERYRDRKAIVAWQVEQEAADPLGMEHSWRLAAAFIEREVEAVRAADPGRPIMMNGFLPTSLAVLTQQWWRTRDQGDSLALAQRLADIVGIDFYPRHALVRVGGRTAYLEGSRSPWAALQRRRLFAWAWAHGRRLMVSEGQAEPWETVTAPPDPRGSAMYSCLPEHVIENYNQCISWAREAAFPLDAYLFWGAEYWMLRRRGGDPSYIEAFQRILERA